MYVKVIYSIGENEKTLSDWNARGSNYLPTEAIRLEFGTLKYNKRVFSGKKLKSYRDSCGPLTLIIGPKETVDLGRSYEVIQIEGEPINHKYRHLLVWDVAVYIEGSDGKTMDCIHCR